MLANTKLCILGQSAEISNISARKNRYPMHVHITYIYAYTCNTRACMYTQIHMHSLTQEAFPARFKGIHLINQPWYISILLTVIMPFMKQKFRDRVSRRIRALNIWTPYVGQLGNQSKHHILWKPRRAPTICGNSTLLFAGP